MKLMATYKLWKCISSRGLSSHIPKNIVVTGAPGSGKTTVAKMLAEKLDMKAIDVDDDHLEPLWGMPVAEKVKELEPGGFQVTESFHFTSILHF